MKANKYPNKALFPCPLCKKNLDIRISKKQKPYCVCRDCEIQLFIRGKSGISRLEEATGFKQDGPSTEDLQWVSRRLVELKKELREVDKEIEADFWEDHPELREKREEILWEIKLLGG